MNDFPQHEPSAACVTCPSRFSQLKKLGLNVSESDCVIALAGNPNTGKTTVFNALTGLRMHTGNWPGKTIARAEGAFQYEQTQYKIVDLPGTYSLLSASPDEEVARSFLVFGQPDVTVLVADATCLERNLNLILQVLQITRKAVLCLNLMDEAKAHHITVDDRQLARELGIPVVPCSVRSGQGIPELLREISTIAHDSHAQKPRKLPLHIPGLNQALDDLEHDLLCVFPHLQQPRWIAMRLLEGDREIMRAIETGDIASLQNFTPSNPFAPSPCP